MEAQEWSLAAVFEVVAGAVPDRDMLVWKRRPADLRGGRGAHAELRRVPRSAAASASAASAASSSAGSAARRPVALLLYNCPEYIESMLGCFRARAVPFNVNQHYRPEEIRGLLDMVGAEAVVYHRALGPLLAEAARGARPRARRRRRRLGRPRRSPAARASRTPSRKLAGARSFRSRRPTTSTWCARAARPARRRACCGARATSSSQRWAAAEGATRGEHRRAGALPAAAPGSPRRR